jgi:ankyrin repeat protein
MKPSQQGGPAAIPPAVSSSGIGGPLFSIHQRLLSDARVMMGGNGDRSLSPAASYMIAEAVMSGDSHALHQAMDRVSDLTDRPTFDGSGYRMDPKLLKGARLIHLAAWWGDTRIVDEMLNIVWDVTSRDDSGAGICHFAAVNGQGRAVSAAARQLGS